MEEVWMKEEYGDALAQATNHGPQAGSGINDI